MSPHSYWPDCNWCPSKKRRYDGFTAYDTASFPLLASRTHRRRAVHERRGGEDVIQIPEVGGEEVVPAPLQNPPTGVLGSLPVIAGSSTGTPTTTTPTDNVMTEAPDPALAKAKTTQASPCSTSPTKSMPPSASKFSNYPSSMIFPDIGRALLQRGRLVHTNTLMVKPIRTRRRCRVQEA